MSSIEGRVALITGASRGIGASVAHALSGAGARVVLASRSEDDLGIDGALAAPCDVRDLGALESLAAAARERFGGVDIVVANAGVGAYGNFLDLDVDVLNEIIDTNVKGLLYTIRATLPLLFESDARGAGRDRVDRRPARPGGRGGLLVLEVRPGRLHALARSRALEPRRSLLDDLPGRGRDRLRDGPRSHARRSRSRVDDAPG